MRRSAQQQGVRKWYGQDLLDLQAEPLKVIDSLLNQYGSYVVSGCEVAANGAKYNVAAGLVVLSGTDPDGATIRIVVPYAGATATTLPLYLTLGYEIVQRVYDDGVTRPVAINYTAVSSAVKPAGGESLAITTSATRRLVDALQDSQHQMITDAERASWTSKETPFGAQGRADEALNFANEYTDRVKEALIAATNQGLSQTQTTLNETINKRADSIVGAAPAGLNTLAEIASAINNDATFNATIRALIAARADATLSNVSLSKSYSANGYYRAPDGLMLQWGSATSNNYGSATIYFPTAFPYIFGFHTCTNYCNSTTRLTATNYITVTPSYATTKTLHVGDSCYEGSYPFYWLAIGRWK